LPVPKTPNHTGLLYVKKTHTQLGHAWAPLRGVGGGEGWSREAHSINASELEDWHFYFFDFDTGHRLERTIYNLI
jgi:hypothetical protein